MHEALGDSLPTRAPRVQGQFVRYYVVTSDKDNPGRSIGQWFDADRKPIGKPHLIDEFQMTKIPAGYRTLPPVQAERGGIAFIHMNPDDHQPVPFDE